MMQIQWHETSGESERYESGAFASLTGQRVPFCSYPGGPQIGWATVTDVLEDDDGLGITWTVEVDLPARETIALADRASFSFRPEDGAVLVRDPLASKPAVIRNLPEDGMNSRRRMAWRARRDGFTAGWRSVRASWWPLPVYMITGGVTADLAFRSGLRTWLLGLVVSASIIAVGFIIIWAQSRRMR